MKVHCVTGASRELFVRPLPPDSCIITPVAVLEQATMVVNGNPVVHKTQPDETGQASVEVEVATATEGQPHGAVTYSAGQVSHPSSGLPFLGTGKIAYYR